MIPDPCQPGETLSALAPSQFDELIELTDPAGLLLVIASKLKAQLRARVTPEDVLQEALLHAWRDRGQCRWAGIRAFRAYLLELIEHRIGDFADHEFALKRGGGAPTIPLQPWHRASGAPAALIDSVTPGRMLRFRERADAISDVLNQLPEGLRDIVRMRIVERRHLNEIARLCEISEPTVRRRFRAGLEEFDRLFAQRYRGLISGMSEMIDDNQGALDRERT